LSSEPHGDGAEARPERNTSADAAAARRRSDLIGGGLAVLGALLFGLVVVLGKGVVERTMTAGSMLAFRFGVAAIVLVVALVLMRRPILAVKEERVGLALLAMFGYAVEATFFFTAIQHGTVAAVTLLFYLYPVIVTLASWLLGRGAPATPTIVALVLAVAGAAIVVAGGTGLTIETAGVVFALAAAVTFTAYLIGTDIVLRRTSPLTSATWVSAGASIGLFVFTTATGRLTTPQVAADWWAILAMGIATAGAFVCLMGALQLIGAVRTSIVSAAEPLAAALLGFLFLGETVGIWTALGGALILAAAVIASVARQATPQEQQIT
jgi:drug/metabolite transporter (DMT)-like permease